MSQDERLRVQGRFTDPDEAAAPLLMAIGRAVFCVAGLENALQMEVSRLLLAQAVAAGQPLDERRLSALDTETVGRLLSRLRELGLPPEVDARIGAVVNRRNALVHHLYEDPQLLMAFAGRDKEDAALRQLERLAIDAAELTVELHLYAVPKLEEMLGMSLGQMVDAIRAADTSALRAPRDQRRLEALRAFGDLDDLLTILDEMNDPS
jgi:hypothetical protein